MEGNILIIELLGAGVATVITCVTEKDNRGGN